MTKNDFVWICNQHNILPNIALEDDIVKKIIKSNSKSLVKQFALNTYLKENL